MPRPVGKRFKFRMRHHIFFVHLLKSMPNLLDRNLLKVKSSKYWYEIRGKFRKQFGSRISLITFKRELINLVKHTKSKAEKLGDQLDEPWKSIHEMYVSNINCGSRALQTSNETDTFLSEENTDQCGRCGNSYNSCNRCEKSFLPFTKSGKFWAEEMLQDTSTHTLSNPLKDKKIENLLIEWQAESLKNKLEESKFKRKITETKSSAQKLELEILQFQREEAQLKVQTAKIKRSIMEFIFSQKMYLHTVSDDQIII